MSTTLDAVLAEALDDEYKSRAKYRAVIDAFGPVRPFVNIVESEGRHVDALLHLHQRFGLVPPPDAWHDRAQAPASLADACREAVAGEKANGAMYDRLLAATDESEVILVLRNLQRASQMNHLPAFERCLARHTHGVSDDAGVGPRRRRHRHGGGHGDAARGP